MRLVNHNKKSILDYSEPATISNLSHQLLGRKSMKAKQIVLAVCVLMLVGVVNAGLIEIVPGQYFGAESLNQDDELLMTGGWGDSISMSWNSLANIYATDEGKQVTNITAGSSSTLNIFGGTFEEIETSNSNLTTIKGGDIGTLICAQDVTGEGGVIIPMTTLYVSEWSYNASSMSLTGKWQDLTSFSIQLEDRYGISTYDNLQFVPEPSSLALLSLASLTLRRRK